MRRRRAVVGAGAVVVGAASELGEEQHYHVVRGVVLSEVIEETLDGFGDVLPELVVHTGLVGVGVEGAVVAVEDAGAEPGLVNLRDSLELGGDGGVRILDGGGVHPGGFLQDVRTLQGVEAGLAQVVHDGGGAHDRGVETGEAVQDLGTLLGLGDAREEAVGLQVVDAGDGDARHGQGAE